MPDREQLAARLVEAALKAWDREAMTEAVGAEDFEVVGSAEEAARVAVIAALREVAEAALGVTDLGEGRHFAIRPMERLSLRDLADYIEKGQEGSDG